MVKSITRSITPETLKETSLTNIKISDSEQELIVTTASISLVKDQGKKFQQAAQKSIQELKTATNGIIDHSKLERSSNEFDELLKEYEAKTDRLNKYQELVKKYNKFLDKDENKNLDIYCYEKYKNSTNEVHRFGLNTNVLTAQQSKELTTIVDKTVQIKTGSVSSAVSKKEMDSPHIMHPLEVFQIKNAIQCATTNKNKTVLVNIFERNNDGSIILEKETPKIHTVILCIQSNDILVIDPSNSDFSKHIAYNGDIICGYSNPMKILVSDIPIKIYAPPDKTSPIGILHTDYRNCTDIAVKLAFGIEKHHSEIDMKKLKELELVQEITNQNSVNEQLFFDSQKAIARVRQSSENDIREKAQKLISSIDKQSKTANLYGSDLEDKILDKGIEFFANISDNYYSQQTQNLEAMHSDNITLLGEMMNDAI